MLRIGFGHRASVALLHPRSRPHHTDAASSAMACEEHGREHRCTVDEPVPQPLAKVVQIRRSGAARADHPTTACPPITARVAAGKAGLWPHQRDEQEAGAKGGHHDRHPLGDREEAVLGMVEQRQSPGCPRSRPARAAAPSAPTRSPPASSMRRSSTSSPSPRRRAGRRRAPSRQARGATAHEEGALQVKQHPCTPTPMEPGPRPFHVVRIARAPVPRSPGAAPAGRRGEADGQPLHGPGEVVGCVREQDVRGEEGQVARGEHARRRKGVTAGADAVMAGRLGPDALRPPCARSSSAMTIQLDAAEQLVEAVPLHEVGPAHEGAVLGGPAEVVPEVEVDELDRLVERVGRQQLLLAERLHDARRLLDHLVGRRDDAPRPPCRTGRSGAWCGTSGRSPSCWPARARSSAASSEMAAKR